MNCPECGGHASMKSPDYGRGAEYVCYSCNVYGRRFVDRSEQAQRESADSRSASAANAAACRDRK